MITTSKRMSQRAHIKSWRDEEEGQREYPRPVYAFGPGPNKKAPQRKPRAAVVKAWYAGHVAKQSPTSVFNPLAVFRAAQMIQENQA
jgi:hypothetical protein